MHPEQHYTNRSGWLRAAVLGANDGILSTSSLVIGIAAATPIRTPIVLAALAGVVAGALSMAAGEYVSVSSQSDIEQSDLAREKGELDTMAAAELEELTQLYVKRGLDEPLAKQVAIQLTAHNALEAHARDELGIYDITQAKPFQAAIASAASFVSGGALPLLVALFAPLPFMVWGQYLFAIIFLALTGTVAARTGGSDVRKSVIRNCFWGTAAMGISALVGHVFGVHVG